MRVLLFTLLLAICTFAADVADSTVTRGRNIPLPRQTAFTDSGLSIGIGAGIYNPTEDCDCMGTWQVQTEYFYAPWISAGIDVRYFGGDLDSDVMVMYQRYRLNARVHKAWTNFDIYVEPVLGFENTSISEFREQMRTHTSSKQKETIVENDSLDGVMDTVLVDTLVVEKKPVKRSRSEKCEKMFSLDGFSLGIGTGFGYKFNRFWGVTGSALFEYNFSRAMLLSLTPGVALDLQELWPWAKNHLRSTWISLEIGAQRYFNRGVDEWATYGLIGIQLAI